MSTEELETVRSKEHGLKEKADFLKPYPKYKETGFSWLGEIPAHWQCLPHRALFEERKVQGHDKEKLLSVTISRGVILQSELLANTSKKDTSNLDKSKYKLVLPGEVTYNKMRAWQGAIGMSRYRGIVSPAYIVFRFRSSNSPDYFHFLFRTSDFAKEAERWSYGITSDQWSLRPEHFKMIYSCLPPLDEQKNIVRFLHAQDKKINRFIRNRRRLIVVLGEYKQAVINHAVTKGLDPDVPMKDPGVQWLGKVPEHWEVLKIKRIAKINPSRSEAVQFHKSVQKAVFLPMENISVDGRIEETLQRPIRDLWKGFTYFRRGDVIIAKITPCFENGKGACLNELETEIGFGTTELIVLRPSNSVLSNFLFQLTKLTDFRSLGVETMTGAAGQQRISPEFVANFAVPIPPVYEQKEIVDYLCKKTLQIEKMIVRAQREIHLIQEYRTRLVSDVVTGKVDVRDIAVPEAFCHENENIKLDRGCDTHEAKPAEEVR